MKQMQFLKCFMPLSCSCSGQKELVHIRNAVPGLVDVHSDAEWVFCFGHSFFHGIYEK